MKGLLKFVMAAAVMAVCTVSVKAQDGGASEEYIVLGANLPTIDGVGVQIVNGEKTTMEILSTGWWFVELEATENDSISFVGTDGRGGSFVLAELNSESAWVEYALKLSDVWEDDSWKGVPCKYIEIDLSDTQKYAWKSKSEVLPTKVKAVAGVEEKKAVKVMENGVIYIIKDGVKYNMLGIAQ